MPQNFSFQSNMASNFISPCFPHFFPFQMHFLPTFSPSKMQFSSDHSLFTTVQSDDDSWFDAGTKQVFDPAAGGSTHSSPLPCSWSPPLSEADLTCSSPLPCSGLLIPLRLVCHTPLLPLQWIDSPFQLVYLAVLPLFGNRSALLAT